MTALGAAALAREAMLNGRAEGDIAAGRVTVLKLGAGQSAVALLVAFPAPARAARAEPPAITLAASNPAGIDGRARRFPLRFVWQMDAATRFTLGAEDFARLLGPKTGVVLNRPWAEIAAALKLDPQGQVAAALAARDTWSGIVVNWPVDGEAERLPIEMSGLPVFDRERQFAGFRGFGICRDVERMAAIERRRAELPEPPEEPSKVLPFRAPPPPPSVEKAPALSPGEHSAFQELARELSDRLKKPSGQAAGPTSDDFGAEPFVPTMPAAPLPPLAPLAPAEPPRAARNGDAARDTSEGRPILDRLPVGILVYRLNNLIYANRAFLDWTGYGALDALAEAGGLDSLFIETKSEMPKDGNGAKTLTITTVNGNQRPVEGRLFSVAWNKENALVLMINTQPVADDKQSKAAEQSLRRIEAENHELEAILDTATDGVLVLDRAGRVLSGNRSAEALFGYDAGQFTELSFGDLFAPESKRVGARISRADGARERHARCRARSDRTREAGRAGAALHHHGAYRRRREAVRGAARYHRLEAQRRGTDQRQAGRREGVHREIGIPRQDQPRDPHAAQRHHRLLRGDDGRALRARSATSATGNTSRTSMPPAAISSRCSTTCSICPRSRPASSSSPS